MTSASGTNPQILLLISAEPPFSTLSITLPNDNYPKEIIASRLWKISPVSKIPRKYSIARKELSFFSLKKLTKSRRSETDEE